MGVPIHLYEDSQSEQITRFEGCSEAYRTRIAALWRARSADAAHETAPVDSDRVYASRFDLETRTRSPLVNLAELESARSKDALSWVFYRPDGSEMAVYRHTGRGDGRLSVVSGLHGLLEGHTIQSVDVAGTALVVGLDTGEIKVVTCSSRGHVERCETVPLRSGRILDLFAGLLPEFVVCFAADEGLLCTELPRGRTRKLLDVPRARPQHVMLEFPRLSAFDTARLWRCDNVLDGELAPVDAPLRPGEQLLAVDTARHTLLLETSQRYLALEASGGAAGTVLHKADCGAAARAHASAGGGRLFVSEQHLYATSLAVYGWGSRAHRWISLGYSDIRAKYNVCKVLRLALVAAGDRAPPILALLADDGALYAFTVQN